MTKTECRIPKEVRNVKNGEEKSCRAYLVVILEMYVVIGATERSAAILAATLALALGA